MQNMKWLMEQWMKRFHRFQNETDGCVFEIIIALIERLLFLYKLYTQELYFVSIVIINARVYNSSCEYKSVCNKK